MYANKLCVVFLLRDLLLHILYYFPLSIMTENMCYHPAVDFCIGYKLHRRNSVIQQWDLCSSENVCMFPPPVFWLQFGSIWERFSTQVCMMYTTAYLGYVCSHSVTWFYHHITVSSVKYQANVGHSVVTTTAKSFSVIGILNLNCN